MNKYTVLTILGSLLFVVLILWLRPESDIATVITSTIGGVVLLLTYLKVNEVAHIARDVQAVAEETHKSVNSRLDSFIRNAEGVARAEGEKEGRETAEAKHDQEKLDMA